MASVRILHMHSTFDLGGKEARTVQLINHFGDDAVHTMLVADHNAMGAAQGINKSIKIDFPKAQGDLLNGLPAMRRYLKLALYMKQFDLLLSYNWGAMDGVMAHTLFSKMYKLPPLIHHEDGFKEDELYKLKAKRNWFRRIALSRSFGLVVPSKTLEHIARTVWMMPKSRLHQIPNGIDVESYRKKPQRGSFPGFKKRNDDIVVGTIAGLRPVKNIPRLVRAVAAAGDNVRLAIAGDGPDRGAIMAEAQKLGIADRVIMPGYVQDPARYVGLFDIFALSSDSEQYPISLVEAMAAGCAVAATDVGDIRNIVSRANQPFITPAHDEDALANSIRTLAQDTALRARLSDENAHRALHEYQDKMMFSRYRQLYAAAMRKPHFGAS